MPGLRNAELLIHEEKMKEAKIVIPNVFKIFQIRRKNSNSGETEDL